MFVIGNDRNGRPKGRIAWHKIRAEYIQGISQARLAKKYHVSRNSIAKHCTAEGWTEQREEAKTVITQKVVQKTAEIAADNATLAERIKRKLLIRLDQVLDGFPEDTATEIQRNTRAERKIYKLKDLTAMYKDLTSDMAQGETIGNELLQSLMELERRASDD